MPFLLDTNIVSDIIRNPRGAPARQLRNHARGEVVTSIIVAGEMRFGLIRKSAVLQLNRLELLFGEVTVLPFEAPADQIYAEVRHSLEARGVPIGGNDALIAAHALTLDYTLVTGNEREFRRVPRLRVENWLA